MFIDFIKHLFNFFGFEYVVYFHDRFYVFMCYFLRLDVEWYNPS